MTTDLATGAFLFLAGGAIASFIALVRIRKLERKNETEVTRLDKRLSEQEGLLGKCHQDYAEEITRQRRGFEESTSHLQKKILETEGIFIFKEREYQEKLLEQTRHYAEEIESATREFHRRIQALRQEHEGQLKEEREKAFQEGLRRGSQAEEEKAKIFSVMVSPYIGQREISSFFKKSFQLKIGYQYQLLVNGIPCFDPHVVIEQSMEQDQVDFERIERLAINLARAAIAQRAGPAAGAITFSDRPVIERKKGRKNDH